jgi:hypothetical protein
VECTMCVWNGCVGVLNCRWLLPCGFRECAGVAVAGAAAEKPCLVRTRSSSIWAVAAARRPAAVGAENCGGNPIKMICIHRVQPGIQDVYKYRYCHPCIVSNTGRAYWPMKPNIISFPASLLAV